MTRIAADLKHAVRIYAGTPVASAVAILALAVSMAFVSGFLSLWNDLALQPHPGFEDSHRLVTVAMSDGDTMAGTSVTLMEDISENVNLVEGVATDQLSGATVLIGDERVQALSELVVKRYFPLLRPRMHFGRGFQPADHEVDAEPVVVLGYDFWQRHFGGRRDVLGEQLGIQISSFPLSVAAAGGIPAPEVNVLQHRIVGVLAPGMKGTFQQATELWLPFEQIAPMQRRNPGGEAPSIAELYERTAGLTGVGRLAPGANVEALQGELRRRYTPEDYQLIESAAAAGRRLTAIGGVHLDLKARREGMQQVGLFLVGTIVLALVAACNATLFLLSRAPGRMRELAIRTAVGATPRRLIPQLASEASLLVVLSVVLGFLVSLWLVVFLRDLPMFETVRWRDVSPIDWRVLGIISAFVLGLAAMVSLAPVLGLRRLNIGAASRSISARAGWGQKLAGTVQLTAAAVLGSVAIAFGLQLVEYATTDPGFEMEGVVVLNFRPPAVTAGEPLTAQALRVQLTRIREVVGSLPGVESVTYSGMVPGRLPDFAVPVVRGDAAPTSTLPSEEQVELVPVQSHASFPEFLKLRFAHGSPSNEAGASVLVNETAARALWGRTDVVGEPLAVFGSSPVIGVLEDVYFSHPKDGIRPMVFMVSASDSGAMLLRTPSSPAAVRRAIQQEIEAGEIELEIAEVTRLADLWGELFATERARILLTGSAALITVLLAALGVYSTQRYLVAAGRREYAIHAALGAGPKAIGRLAARRGIVVSLPGIVLGTTLAYVATAALRDDYFSETTSPVLATSIAAIALLLLVTGAVHGPARRARRTAPAPLLKEG